MQLQCTCYDTLPWLISFALDGDAVKFDQWLKLSEAEKQAEQARWNAYGNGYWHDLLSEAAKRFEAEFKPLAHVRDIHSGTCHGGELIIGVSTDLPYPQTITLPDSYLGFRVMQFCGGSREPLS
jgi:hypothetical protein